jgi:hypothetical protein
MANQAIALQSRAPQGNFLAPALQQGAQFINMMSQQRAAERQAAAQQQQLEIARAAEGREAALAPSRQSKSEADAGAAQVKYASDFKVMSAVALANARDPQQAVAEGNRLKKMFPTPEFQQSVDETVAYLTQDPAQFDARRYDTLKRTMATTDQLERQLIQQNLGTSTRVLSVPKFGGGAGEVVPGSEVDLGQEVTYLKGGDGSYILMPKRLPMGGGGGGGLVGGTRGGGAVGGVQMGQPIPGTGKPPAAAKPKAGEISPEKKLARDRAVQDLYDAVVDAQKKGHLVSEKQSFIANRAQELRQGRPYLPGGTEQKSSVETIEATAAQLLRQLIEKGTSGTLNALGEQKLFLRSVGGADSTYETRLKTIRNFAKQNGVALDDYAAAAAGATSAAPIGPPPPGVPAAEWKAMSPEDRKLWPQ